MSSRVNSLAGHSGSNVRLFGKVLGVTKTDYTQVSFDAGETNNKNVYTINFDSPQTDVKQGDFVLLSGTVSSDEKTLDKARVETESIDEVDMKTYHAHMNNVMSVQANRALFV